jgi:hypothetical protein
MSTDSENTIDTEVKNNTHNSNSSCIKKINKAGRPRKTPEETIIALEKKREKALQRYYEKKEECAEKSRLNQLRYRELYRYVKELVKENKLDNLSEEDKQNLKKLCLE